jgi:hypothetical protein
MEDGTCEQEDPAQLRQQLKEARNEIEKLRQGLSQKLYYFVLTRSFAYYTGVPSDAGEAAGPPHFTRGTGAGIFEGHTSHACHELCSHDLY